MSVNKQEFLKKHGFYVVLGLSLAAVFTTAFVSVNLKNKQKQQPLVFSEVETTAQGLEGQPVMENKVEEKPTENTTKKAPELKLSRPVAGEIITEFAMDKLIYNSTLKQWSTHSGIDIGAEEGTKVKAAKGGVVESIKNDALMGTTIVIAHDDSVKTVYANLAAETNVNEGDKVNADGELGKIGKTAISEFEMDPHLHFEVLIQGESKNPVDFFK